jgi:hypothetical protein
MGGFWPRSKLQSAKAAVCTTASCCTRTGIHMRDCPSARPSVCVRAASSDLTIPYREQRRYVWWSERSGTLEWRRCIMGGRAPWARRMSRHSTLSPAMLAIAQAACSCNACVTAHVGAAVIPSVSRYGTTQERGMVPCPPRRGRQ